MSMTVGHAVYVELRERDDEEEEEVEDLFLGYIQAGAKHIWYRLWEGMRRAQLLPTVGRIFGIDVRKEYSAPPTYCLVSSLEELHSQRTWATTGQHAQAKLPCGLFTPDQSMTAETEESLTSLVLANEHSCKDTQISNYTPMFTHTFPSHPVG